MTREQTKTILSRLKDFFSRLKTFFLVNLKNGLIFLFTGKDPRKKEAKDFDTQTEGLISFQNQETQTEKETKSKKTQTEKETKSKKTQTEKETQIEKKTQNKESDSAYESNDELVDTRHTQSKTKRLMTRSERDKQRNNNSTSSSTENGNMSSTEGQLHTLTEKISSLKIPAPPAPPPTTGTAQSIGTQPKTSDDNPVISKDPTNNDRSDLLAEIRAKGIKLKKTVPRKPDDPQQEIKDALGKSLEKMRSAISSSRGSDGASSSNGWSDSEG